MNKIQLTNKIQLIVSDIDGVLTDCKVSFDIEDNEYKSLNYRDMDSINYLRRIGVNFALLTGNDTMFADIIAKRLRIDIIVKGSKDKEIALKKISENTTIPLEKICYIGDSDRDIAALKICGLGIVPQDATKRAKKFASIILETKGGCGIMQEVMEYLTENNYIATD